MTVRIEVYKDSGSLEAVIEDPTPADFDLIARIAELFNAAVVDGPAEGGQEFHQGGFVRAPGTD